MDKLLNNKKLLICLAVSILATLTFFLISSSTTKESTTTPPSDTNDSLIDTDSSEFDKDLDDEYAFLKSYPISDLLPVESASPYYYITYNIDIEANRFFIQIYYRDQAGLSAARARLESGDFSSYNPTQYRILESQISD